MPTKRIDTSNSSQDFRRAAEITSNQMASGERVVISGIVDAILEVGRQRHALLGHLRSALQSGQNELALTVARQLCGISKHEESHRTNTRVH